MCILTYTNKYGPNDIDLRKKHYKSYLYIEFTLLLSLEHVLILGISKMQCIMPGDCFKIHIFSQIHKRC